MSHSFTNAMVTNHLRAPYGVYFAKKRTILRRPYGARLAAGRNVQFFIIFLDIVRCPVKFRSYLKFHGARTAFGRVIEGKITSYGARPAFSHIGRAPDKFYLLFISYDSNGARPGIVRCLTSARKLKKLLNKSADVCPGTGRCPSGYRPMFYESNCHR